MTARHAPASLPRRAAYCLAAALLVVATPAAAQVSAPALAPAATRAEQERFLASARVVAAKPVSTGVTGTIRVTLDDGAMRHDASVQRIEETKKVIRGPRGTEFGLRDSWAFNLAAYHLAQLLQLDAVPATVERKYDGQPASFTWWVDDVIMDEGSRQEKKAEDPDPRRWGHQMATLRVFDALIANTDRNKGNLLIDKDWATWFIDHSRAFRRSHEIREPLLLVRCERRLLEALKGLDQATLQTRLGRWLDGDEIRAIIARRDAIVKKFEAVPASVYTYPPTP